MACCTDFIFMLDVIILYINVRINQMTKELMKNASLKIKEFFVSPRERQLRMLVLEWYLVIAVALFCILAIVARMVPYFSLDLYITREVQENRPVSIYEPMYFVSWIGYSPQFPVIIFIICAVIFLLGLKKESVFAGIAGYGSAALSALIKEVISRPRPAADLVTVLHHLKDTSFPSGHTMTYTTFFGFLGILVLIFFKKSGLRILLVITLGLIVILVGPSRIYLGEHWASDVLGGYIMGSVCLLLTVYVYKKS